MAAHFCAKEKCEGKAAHFRRKTAEQLCMGRLSKTYIFPSLLGVKANNRLFKII